MPEPTSRLTDTDRQHLRHLVKLGLNAQAFFDVGASTGRWSERVSEDFPEASFDLFEPLVDHAPDYRLKMEAVLAQHPGFRLHKFALGPEAKRTSMCLYPNNLVGSTALELEALPPSAQWETVDMLTVDYVIQEFRLPVPQVIKMDTQGCELGILQGARATLPKVEVLLLECWLARAYGKHTPLLFEVADWLRGYDFYLWDLGNGWRDTDGTLVAQDCFFLNARSPISRLKHEPSRVQRGCSIETQAARGPAWFQRMTDKLWHP
ncbi:MAG TPA: FkbM family methyltransferase [Candidatus Limnocylindrales bacterium]|jgi:FkbM family methyltransferase|nr:FkbM family methyltransferase [Candidatus Limnocylindrales bacterium]